MKDISKRRREAHYKDNTPEVEAKGNYKIILQLAVCMAIIFCFIYEGVRTTEIGEKMYNFSTKVLSSNIDFNTPYSKIKNVVEKVLKVPSMPTTGTEFNEQTVTLND